MDYKGRPIDEVNSAPTQKLGGDCKIKPFYDIGNSNFAGIKPCTCAANEVLNKCEEKKGVGSWGGEKTPGGLGLGLARQQLGVG